MAGITEFPFDGELDQSGFIVVDKKIVCDPPSTQSKVTPPEFKNRSVKKYHETRLWISYLLRVEPNIDIPSSTVKCYKFNDQLINIVNIYGVVSGVSTNRFGISYSSKWLDSQLYKISKAVGW